MKFIGAGVFTDNKFVSRDVCVNGEFFQDFSEDDICINLEGYYIIPGLTDIHFHGALGYDLCDCDTQGLKKIQNYEASYGITQIVPATMSLDDKRLEEIFTFVGRYESEGGSDFIGVHMEGPYISAKKIGAQNPNYVRKPDIEEFKKYMNLSNNKIKILSLAPETEGALKFIENLKDDVNISLAHSDADYETADSAFKAGAGSVTHLFNAMNPIHHRKPGLIGAASDNENVMVEIISDGVHIHPSIIRMVYKIFGDDRVILVSDSMRACGLDDGEYELGGQKVFVKGNKATLSDGTIAGSVTNLFNCLKFAYSIGIPIESLVRSAAVNSAKACGIYEKYGSIRTGKYANFIVIDRELDIKAVYIKGKEFKGDVDESI